MSSLCAQHPPQQWISRDKRDFATKAEPLQQPFSAVFDPAEPFQRGNFYATTAPQQIINLHAHKFKHTNMHTHTHSHTCTHTHTHVHTHTHTLHHSRTYVPLSYSVPLSTLELRRAHCAIESVVDALPGERTQCESHVSYALGTLPVPTRHSHSYGIHNIWIFTNDNSVQWNLSKTTSCGPVLIKFYRDVAALQRYIAMFSTVVNSWVARELIHAWKSWRDTSRKEAFISKDEGFHRKPKHLNQALFG